MRSIPDLPQVELGRRDKGRLWYSQQPIVIYVKQFLADPVFDILILDQE